MEKKKIILINKEIYENKDLRTKTEIIVKILDYGDLPKEKQVSKYNGPMHSYTANKAIRGCNIKLLINAIKSCDYPHIVINISNKYGAIADYDYFVEL